MAFGCHIAIAAPVGSVMTLIVPCSPTSMTSTTTQRSGRFFHVLGESIVSSDHAQHDDGIRLAVADVLGLAKYRCCLGVNGGGKVQRRAGEKCSA